MEGKYVYVMTNVPAKRVAIAPGSDGEKRIWLEYEVRCAVSREGDEKTRPTIGYVDFREGACRTGKGVVRFYARDGGLRTIDVEDIITVGSTSVTRS